MPQGDWRLLNGYEAARQLRIDDCQLEALVAEGKLRCIIVGSELRISEAELRRFVRQEARAIAPTWSPGRGVSQLRLFPADRQVMATPTGETEEGDTDGQ